jgi:two-component system, sensor histidine kinase PdtaS
VSLRHSLPDRLELTVADDGTGISAERLKSASRGTGLDLVRMLARQLDASLEVDHVQGTTVRVAFKDAAAGAISL